MECVPSIPDDPRVFRSAHSHLLYRQLKSAIARKESLQGLPASHTDPATQELLSLSTLERASAVNPFVPSNLAHFASAADNSSKRRICGCIAILLEAESDPKQEI